MKVLGEKTKNEKELAEEKRLELNEEMTKIKMKLEQAENLETFKALIEEAGKSGLKCQIL